MIVKKEEDIYDFDIPDLERLQERNRRVTNVSESKSLVNKIKDQKQVKKKTLTNIQRIINRLFKEGFNKENVNTLKNIQGLSREQEDFVHLVLATKYYNKRLYIPKSLCIKPIEIYLYSNSWDYYRLKKIGEREKKINDIEDVFKTNFFTNDLLFWSFIYYKFIVLTDMNDENVSQINKDAYSCFELTNVSIVTESFPIDNKEVKFGYMEDFNDNVSFINYDETPQEVIDMFFSDKQYKDIKKESLEFKLNNVNYTALYHKSFILLYRSDMNLNDVKNVVEKQRIVISKKNNIFEKGFKEINRNRGFFYFQVPKINLSNFSPSVVIMNPSIEISFKVLFTVKIDVSKFSDILYKEYSSDDKFDFAEAGSKELVDKGFLSKKRKYEEYKEIVNKRKDLVKAYKKGEDAKRQQNELDKRYSELKEKVFENDLLEKEFCLDSDFIYWSNFPSCFEFYGVIGYAINYKKEFDELSEYYRYVYEQYHNLKSVISLWKKLFHLVERIICDFYDAFSDKIPHDRVLHIEKLYESFFKIFYTLKNDNLTFDAVKRYFNNIKRNSRCINHFFNKMDFIEELILQIKYVVEQIKKYDITNLVENIRAVGSECYKCFVDPVRNVNENEDEYEIIIQLRSKSAFLGHLDGGKNSNDIDNMIKKLLNKIKKDKDVEKKKKDFADKTGSDLGNLWKLRLKKYLETNYPKISYNELFYEGEFNKNIVDDLIKETTIDYINQGYDKDKVIKLSYSSNTLKNYLDKKKNLKKLNKENKKLLNKLKANEIQILNEKEEEEEEDEEEEEEEKEEKKEIPKIGVSTRSQTQAKEKKGRIQKTKGKPIYEAKKEEEKKEEEEDKK